VDGQGGAGAGDFAAQPRPRQPVETFRALDRHIILTDILPYIASYVVMALILQISSGILAEAGLSILGLGPKNDGSAHPGADDELGDDLPGAHPGKMVGVLPRDHDHRADYVLDEPDEYGSRPGIQPGIERLGEGD
jgi:hypothetical protein